AGLPGFYDPCVGEEKSLKLLYQFRGVMHQVISADSESLRIPKQCKYAATFTCDSWSCLLITILLKPAD
ncbi:DnaJ (Hsp40), subfamily C, member 11, partial [Goodea atripinnis]